MEVKVGGVQKSMQAHLRSCPNQPKDESEEKNGEKSDDSSLKKRKLSQTTFTAAKKGTPFTEKEFAEFEKQALRAALDANLAFHWTDSYHVKKLFLMMKPEVLMPRRRTVSGRILDEENKECINSGLDMLRMHGKYGISLSLDAWKNIKKQSLLGSIGSVIGSL